MSFSIFVLASHYYKWHHGEVHYHKRGMGDPLVLVHNVYPGASHEEFARNIPELARHFTVYALDLLGFGQGDLPRLKYRAQTYVELIFDFLREEVARPAHVVSTGLSCAYVTEVAAWRPNLFDKLVFICPRSEPVGLDTPRWFAPIQRFFLSTPPLGNGFFQTIAGEHELRRYLGNCFYSAKAISPETVARLIDNALQPGSIYPLAALATGYLDWDLLANLPRVDLPLLLLWGRNARPTPVEHGVRLAALARQCRFEVIDCAGSWVHDEQSAKVNALITGYLNDTLPAADNAAAPRRAAGA